jgi:hypothetical protein
MLDNSVTTRLDPSSVPGNRSPGVTYTIMNAMLRAGGITMKTDKTPWLGVLALSLCLTGCGSELGSDSYQVALSYTGGSNHGPTDASGTAVINGGTGQVDIDVSGLPTLAGDVYEGWLAGGDEDPLSTGRFNTDANGTGSSSITLGDLSSRTFENVVITVEPEPDPTPAPDPRHSIEGPIE